MTTSFYLPASAGFEIRMFLYLVSNQVQTNPSLSKNKKDLDITQFVDGVIYVKIFLKVVKDDLGDIGSILSCVDLQGLSPYSQLRTDKNMHSSKHCTRSAYAIQ